MFDTFVPASNENGGMAISFQFLWYEESEWQFPIFIGKETFGSFIIELSKISPKSFSFKCHIYSAFSLQYTEWKDVCMSPKQHQSPDVSREKRGNTV